MKPLTAKELVAAINALQIAANQYRQDAEELKGAGQYRLADQFTAQRMEALDLIEKLEG